MRHGARVTEWPRRAVRGRGARRDRGVPAGRGRLWLRPRVRHRRRRAHDGRAAARGEAPHFTPRPRRRQAARPSRRPSVIGVGQLSTLTRRSTSADWRCIFTWGGKAVKRFIVVLTGLLLTLALASPAAAQATSITQPVH